MEILERLKTDLRESLIKRDARKASILRIVLSSAKNFEIDKGSVPTDAELVFILKSEIRKIKDSISEFSKAGREDLIEKEKADLGILLQYVPAQMSEEDTRKIVKEVFQEISRDEREFGKVMGIIMKKYREKIDGSILSKIVKEELMS